MHILKVKKTHPNAVLPARATDGSAGYDLYALLDTPVTIQPGESVTICSGIAIELESSGYAALIFGRSGLGVRHGVTPANAVGVVDSDYRGEIAVGLRNHSQEPYIIHPGDRFAQMVIIPVYTPELAETEGLSETARGGGGFGSTSR